MSARVGFAFPAMAACLLALAVGAQAESHIRIVRLSYIDGQVQMEHADQGLDRAILNTPIVEGTRIVTRNDGLAEVEFEDQSALRLAGNSEVKFRRLTMTDTGAKVNEIEVVRGVVFFDVLSKSDDVYRAVAGGTTFLVRRDSQTRISAAPDQLQLAVFKGSVQLENQPQLVSVKKSETLTLDPNKPAEYKVAHGTEPLPVDAWNKEREAYDAAYAHNAGYGGPKSGYGLQDLNYYGEYFYAPSYGYVWQPYGFANSMAGWSPYSNGAWGFVPGFGYTWASAYPWGWLPYHYGSWAFLGGGVGWAWVPGSYAGPWYATNFVGTPVVAKAPVGWQPATAPVAAAGNSPKPTILVGKAAAGSPAYISGGRIPPNFASVIAGRNVGPNAATSGLITPNVRNERAAGQSVFVPRTIRSGQSGHVFAAPSSVSAASMSSGFNSMSNSSAIGGGAGPGGTVSPAASTGGHASSSHGASHH
jgi:FecR protein